MCKFFCFHYETETRLWRLIYHDIEIPKQHDIEISRPKHCDIEIQGLKHHDIKKWRQLSPNIVIPKHFFRGQKAIWHWDSKTKKPRHQVSAEFWPLCPLIGISQKSRTTDHQHSNRTTKQHQEILSIQNDGILSR